MSSPAERYAAARRRAAAARTELARFADSCDFPLDDFQTQACQALESGSGVLVAAPTGAGKTVVGEFAVHLALAHGLKAFYTTPIKALSNQKYTDLVARYGADRVGLLTGDTSVNAHADVVVMTTEVLRNMLYSGSRRLERLGYVVMDEVHYLADRFRGPVWEEVIIHLPAHVRLVSLSATVSNAEELGDWLTQVRGQAGPTSVVVSEHRPVPLTQHMLVGSRLMDLYSLPVALDSASEEAEHLAAPPLNPDLLSAVNRAQRAAAAQPWRDPGSSSPRSAGQASRRGRHERGSRRRHAGGGRPRSAHHGSIRPPARESVVETLAAANLLPAIVFVFSRAGCDAAVASLLRAGLTLVSDDEAVRIRQVIDERTAHVPASDLAALGFHTWCQALERGFAAHHAGMLPVLKETVEELFSAGLVKVVYATETLALGINMPARTVVLESLRKWNGSAHVTLTPGEYTQLTGRAGRRGIDTQGHAVVVASESATPQVVSELASRRTYPLVSAFRPTYNMAVNLLARSTRARAREVLESSFAQFQADRGAVALASQVRRARGRARGLEEPVSCHLGDFREYALLRARLSEAESTASQERRRHERHLAAQSINALTRGDVVLFRQGRRRRHAVVLSIGADRTGTATLTVLGEDSRVRVLTPDTHPDGVVGVGHLRVAASVDVRRQRDRDRLTGRLLEAVRSGTLSHDSRRRTRGAASEAGGQDQPRSAGSGGPGGPDGSGTPAAREVDRIRQRLREHPCHACPDREEHAHASRAWVKARTELQRLEERMERRTGTIARQFDAVCEVLVALGYLEPADRAHTGRELRVTPAGGVLARVYAERDLLIAQCVRDGVWSALSAADLAGAVSACVYEPRVGAGAGAPVAPRSALGAALRRMGALAHAIHTEETLARLEVSAGVEAGMAGVMAAWAGGAGLGEILSECDVSAGDFVRHARQVLDVLGQLAVLAGADDESRRLSQVAGQAVLDVGRGVVTWSGV